MVARPSPERRSRPTTSVTGCSRASPSSCWQPHRPRAGLLLCLDDLHWADGPTLLLLQHLARGIVPSRAPFLMIGAYRTVELSLDHPLLDVLANLTRERLAERLLLGPSRARCCRPGQRDDRRAGRPDAPRRHPPNDRGNPSSSKRSSATWRRRGFSVEHGVRALDNPKLEPVGVPKVCARSSDGGSRG